MKTTLQGFGINVDLNHFDQYSIGVMTDTIQAIRAQWVRLEICSRKYAHPEQISGLILFAKKCQELKIPIVGLFSDFVPLTFKNLFFPEIEHRPIMSRLSEYEEFVKKILVHATPHIDHWEIWNEQNSKRFWIQEPSPEEYMVLLRRVTKLIKSKQKNATIIFGGIFGNDITPTFSFNYEKILISKQYIQRAISAGAMNLVEYVAFHPYVRDCHISVRTGKEIYTSIIQRIEETIAQYPKLPLIVSEIGVSPLLNLRVKAQEIAEVYQKLIHYSNTSNIPLCIYTLSDQHGKFYSSFNPERNFGFLDFDLRPKPLLNEYLKLL